jgi:O-acetyl-ADP-ribose deacetylase (regulator of RNase III)
MTVITINGNIFDSPCNVLVNPTNCKGPMGAGLAKQFRDRYPGLEKRYKEFCTNGMIVPGILSLYPINENLRILNFPTKDDWRNSSEFRYVELGMNKFLKTYSRTGIKTIAFPLLGTGLGGLDKEKIKEYMISKLDPLLDLYVEIYC